MKTKSSVGMWGGAGVVLFAVAMGACGGANAGPAAPATKAADRTPAMSKLGHFSSADGMVHLTIDRTGEKVKIQLDGSKDIVELTQKEVRERGELLGYAFLAPDGTRALFISTSGSVVFIKGETESRAGDELPLLRDGDAVALGAPTVKGEPPGPKPPEKSKNELLALELEKISVVKRFPQFKPADAGNLAKVAEAYQLATTDMVMTCGERCGAWYAPHPVKDGKGGLGFVRDADLKQGPATAEEKKAPLSKYNAWLRPEYEFGDWTHEVVKSSWLSIFQLEFRKLQPKSPVLVWDVEGTDVFVVTPDGSRYWDSPTDNEQPVFTKGLAPQAEWPAPLPNNLLFREHVEAMGAAGLIDKKVADEIEGIHAKWGECAKKVFAPAQKEIEANLAGPDRDRSASAKNNLVRRKYNEKAMKDCGGKRAETLLVEILASRDKAQRALYEKNKARLAALK